MWIHSHVQGLPSALICFSRVKLLGKLVAARQRALLENWERAFEDKKKNKKKKTVCDENAKCV